MEFQEVKFLADLTDKETDEKRTDRVFEALESRNERLAGTYAAAIRELGTTPRKGGETARVSIICHCMREVIGGIPSAMAVAATRRPNPSSMSLVSGLPVLLESHPELDLRAEQAYIPLPSEVALALARLVEAAAIEANLNVANAAALLTDGIDTKHPLIKQWKTAQNFFLEWVHLDRNPDGARKLPSDEAIRSQIRVVEDVVEVRSNLFFTNLDAVQDLLNMANATDGTNQA